HQRWNPSRGPAMPAWAYWATGSRVNAGAPALRARVRPRVTTFAFQGLDLSCLWATVLRSSLASGRILERLDSRSRNSVSRKFPGTVDRLGWETSIYWSAGTGSPNGRPMTRNRTKRAHDEPWRIASGDPYQEPGLAADRREDRC